MSPRAHGRLVLISAAVLSAAPLAAARRVAGRDFAVAGTEQNLAFTPTRALGAAAAAAAAGRSAVFPPAGPPGAKHPARMPSSIKDMAASVQDKDSAIIDADVIDVDGQAWYANELGGQEDWGANGNYAEYILDPDARIEFEQEGKVYDEYGYELDEEPCDLYGPESPACKEEYDVADRPFWAKDGDQWDNNGKPLHAKEPWPTAEEDVPETLHINPYGVAAADPMDVRHRVREGAAQEPISEMSRSDGSDMPRAFKAWHEHSRVAKSDDTNPKMYVSGYKDATKRVAVPYRAHWPHPERALPPHMGGGGPLDYNPGRKFKNYGYIAENPNDVRQHVLPEGPVNYRPKRPERFPDLDGDSWRGQGRPATPDDTTPKRR